MRDKMLFLALAVAAGNMACAGEIYRCVAANGDVSYTNIACPAKSRVERVASYEPDNYVAPPAPAENPATSAAQDSADEARVAALQAREAALEARIAYEQAQAEQAPVLEPGQADVSSPLWLPAYLPYAPRFRGRRGHSHRDHVVHLNGPPTPVRSPRWAEPPGGGSAPRFYGHR